MKDCRCIVCNMRMSSIDKRGFQPSGGLAFKSGGHYGSAAFDPVIGGGTLEIAVCDGCLLKAGERGIVAHELCVQSPRHEYSTWRPSPEDKADFAFQQFPEGGKE